MPVAAQGSPITPAADAAAPEGHTFLATLVRVSAWLDYHLAHYDTTLKRPSEAGGIAAWRVGMLQTMRVHGVSNAAQSAIRSVSERVDKERSYWQSTEQLLIVLWAKLQAGAPCAERCRLTTSPPPKLRNAAGDFVTKHNRIYGGVDIS